MRIMSEETFGPAVGIMEVRDDAEAVAMMNDSSLRAHRVGVDRQTSNAHSEVGTRR